MDKVSLQPKLEELSPNYDVSTTKSDTCPNPTKAQIQEINPVNPNVRLLFTSFFIKKKIYFPTSSPKHSVHLSVYLFRSAQIPSPSLLCSKSFLSFFHCSQPSTNAPFAGPPNLSLVSNGPTHPPLSIAPPIEPLPSLLALLPLYLSHSTIPTSFPLPTPFPLQSCSTAKSITKFCANFTKANLVMPFYH